MKVRQEPGIEDGTTRYQQADVTRPLTQDSDGFKAPVRYAVEIKFFNYGKVRAMPMGTRAIFDSLGNVFKKHVHSRNIDRLIIT